MYAPYDIIIRSVVAKSIRNRAIFVAVCANLAVLAAGLVEREVRPEKGAHDGPPEHGHRVRAHQFANERHRAVLQHAHDVLPHQVQVFLAHLRHLVLDFPRVVDHHEGGFQLLGLLVKLIVLMD